MTGKIIMIRNFIKLSLLSIFISPILVAQELTSDITGSVSSSSGAVSGAQVEITYEPTNTTVTTTPAMEDCQVYGIRVTLLSIPAMV